ncbi:hypothetical protein C8R43DRAFT_1013469 [Mycena crocata]|nr:hypothetical protein C8R43DRAFT_1013469 [Mycena crocata]
MPMPDIGQLTIPLFIGTVMNWSLMGALVVQVYLYFLAFPQDRRVSKILVTFIFLAELAQTLGDTRNTIRTFGSGWGDFQELDNVGWVWLSVPVMGSSIASAGQLFFAWRIYIISDKKKYVPALIAAVTMIQLGAGIWTGVLIARAAKFSRLEFDHLKTPVVWLAATAASDILIVLGMIYYVLKARIPEFRTSTQAALGRIIKVTVETGMLCALFACVDLALFVSFNGNNYHLGVCIWLSKVYSNSIMVILNSRAYIAPARPERTARFSDMMFHSKIPGPSAVQVAIEPRMSDEHSTTTDPHNHNQENKYHAPIIGTDIESV